jgi:arsenate reductase
MVLDLLNRLRFPTEHLRSKDWNEFATPDAPKMDFVFTVCDKAAAEVCPIWPGQPMSADWGVPDPVAVKGDEKERMMAFRQAFSILDNRIKLFVSLPLNKLQGLKPQARLDEIGRSTPGTE